jgi:hypothetical protein
MDYSNGKIYKIIDATNGDVYIGSTCKTLEERLKAHQYNYKSYLNGDLKYMSSYNILKNNNYSIELLENCVCESKIELKERERFYILNNKCVNRNIPNRTDKEYYRDNQDKIKEYRQEHQNKMKEYNNEYYKQNQEKLRQYYQDNKEKINKKFTCECGGCYTFQNKARHFKSLKHQNYLKEFKDN